MDKIDRIKELVSQLNKYRKQYYVEDNPKISDPEYDALFDELVKLEKETGFVLSNSPTITVGYTVETKLKKIVHPISLLSLNKTKSADEVKSFIGNKETLLMLKYDGLTVELDYNNGELIEASTRGDGHEGEIITHNAKVFKNVPLHISDKGFKRITGEAIIHRNDFNKINENLTDEEKKKLPSGKYKTPRNLVAGSVRQLDSKICAERNVYFYPWDIIEGYDSNSRKFELENMTELGFEKPEFVFFSAYDSNMPVQMAIDGLQAYAINHNIPIDGIVARYNNIEYSHSLGVTSHHPLDGLAFKFEDEFGMTVLEDVEWSMGRTGILTPVAIVDPVELDGTTVSRASLHNISIIENLELGLQDELKIIKSNMIIPQITYNYTRSNNLIIPDSCPECGGKTEIRQENDSKILVCTNPKCSGKLLSRFSHFVSKPAMNIDGLSEASLEKFINNGWLKTFADIYHLDEHKSEIINMDGFGKKSYDKMWTAITNSREVNLSNFLVSLGVSNLGKTASKTISKYFNGDWQKFILSFPHNFDWTTLDDFGDVISNSLNNYFFDLNNRDEWKSLLDEVTFIKLQQTVGTDNTTTDNPFTGKTVVATGSLKNFSRESIQAKIESLGAKAGNSVSKKTDYVLVGENAGSKLQKAKELNVNIITEEEFLKMIG